ncbi:MAG: phenylalanine--tRNA ligase subunit beta [Vampirovibrionales bacterium]
MKLSTRWLFDCLTLPPEAPTPSPSQLANALTHVGLEVEGDVHDAPPIGFSNVILAKVEAVEPHPNSDKLRLATINRGSTLDSIQVVCGAPNLAVGQRIAFANAGAVVFNRKANEWFTLGTATIRGVESSGMCCALDELGLAERYPKTEEGIWVLNPLVQDDSQLGQPLEVVLGLNNEPADTVLETAPTANRGDWMSYRGVAREVVALYGGHVNEPERTPLTSLTPTVATGNTRFNITLETAIDVCTRYYGIELHNVRVAPSPAWLQQRLEASGVRSINNVVDITNYVMLEYGQPLHAFDADKLASVGETISVRYATLGETLACLDDATYTLTPQTVYITANHQPVALAGVMGGDSTKVDDTTQRLLLEGAFFPSLSTRRSARSVGIRTESSARFERGVDEAGVQTAVERAIYLYQTVCEATVAGVSFAETAPIEAPTTLSFSLASLEKVVGRAYEASVVEQTLTALGFGVAWLTPTEARVTVPSVRQKDVRCSEDLIEEVIRIVGYESIPATLPTLSTPVVVASRSRLIQRLHTVLQGLGFNEWMTNSLVGPELLERMCCPDDAQQRIELINTHSQDHVWMRQSFLPSLLQVAQHNVANGVTALWGYELGRTYHKRGKASHKQTGVQEKLMLGLFLLGHPQQQHWQGKQSIDFFTLKGKLETLFSQLDLAEALSFERPSTTEALAMFHPGRVATVLLDGKPCGVLGQTHPSLQQRLKLKQPSFMLELDADKLLKRCEQHLKQQQTSLPTPLQLSNYPAVSRDIAILVLESVSHAQLAEALASKAPEALQSLTLFDTYQGEGVPAGMRSLAYRLTYQSFEGTLNDATVDAWNDALRQHVVASFGAVLR